VREGIQKGMARVVKEAPRFEHGFAMLVTASILIHHFPLFSFTDF
jgi:hypothetical protein